MGIEMQKRLECCRFTLHILLVILLVCHCVSFTLHVLLVCAPSCVSFAAAKWSLYFRDTLTKHCHEKDVQRWWFFCLWLCAALHFFVILHSLPFDSMQYSARVNLHPPYPCALMHADLLPDTSNHRHQAPGWAAQHGHRGCREVDHQPHFKRPIERKDWRKERDGSHGYPVRKCAWAASRKVKAIERAHLHASKHGGGHCTVGAG